MLNTKENLISQQGVPHLYARCETVPLHLASFLTTHEIAIYI